jgi:hypothetical protein
MNTSAKPLFPVESEHVGREEYVRWRKEFHEFAADFADEHDLSFGMMSLLLMDLAVSSRQIHYVMSVEKPSVSGMRIELDRFQREVGDFLRSTKKTADEFIRSAKNALEQTDDLAEAQVQAEALPDKHSPK